MSKYSDKDIKKARDLVKPHGGILSDDLELALDLIGPELGIYPQNNTSDIAEQTDYDLMEKNLVVPEEYVPPRGPIPNVLDVEELSFSVPDLEWRTEDKPRLNLAQRLAQRASWLSSDEQQELQLEINKYTGTTNIPYQKIGDERELNQQCRDLSSNGCGTSSLDYLVPDKGYKTDYSDECAFHDDLYALPNVPKEFADNAFNKGLLVEISPNFIAGGYSLPRSHHYATGV